MAQRKSPFVWIYRVLTIGFLLFIVLILDLLASLFVPYNRPSRPRNQATFIVSSPTQVHQFIPNGHFFYNGVEYRTNSLGFRDREFVQEKSPGSLRVAILGDSFIEGMGENQDDTIPKVMERLIHAEARKPVTVMNCGIRGGSPAVYQFWIRKMLEYDLDCVLICVFSNDMDDDACALLQKSYYRALDWYSLPRWLKWSSLVCYTTGEVAEIKFKLKRRSISTRIFNEDNFIRDNKRKDGDVNAVGSNAFGYFVETEKWGEHWERTKNFLGEILQVARGAGVPILFVYIPSNSIVPNRPKWVPDKKLNSPGSGFQTDLLGLWMQKWTKEEGAPYVDLSQDIMRWYRNPQNPPLFQSDYAHLNRQGLAFAAKAIKPAVLAALKK